MKTDGRRRPRGESPWANAGRVGIEEGVAQVFRERVAFTMRHVSEVEVCGETGCAEHTVPVQVPRDEFDWSR